ncbi:hypothetical protein [Salsuginibacillus kocurii]|uniref:hypothetical protein n=1 Tax=Salsuginibacillus kocurii TaxID=427078 RepID=UPI0003798D4C|nr:hypothetical protein [Salsuginibacillus kocurii]
MPFARNCPACGGTGLLMDDEEWRYTCSICGGNGEVDIQGDIGMSTRSTSSYPDTDEMNRTID